MCHDYPSRKRLTNQKGCRKACEVSTNLLFFLQYHTSYIANTIYALCSIIMADRIVTGAQATLADNLYRIPR